MRDSKMPIRAARPRSLRRRWTRLGGAAKSTMTTMCRARRRRPNFPRASSRPHSLASSYATWSRANRPSGGWRRTIPCRNPVYSPPTSRAHGSADEGGWNAMERTDVYILYFVPTNKRMRQHQNGMHAHPSHLIRGFRPVGFTIRA